MGNTKKKISIRGMINALNVGDKPLIFDRKNCLLSSVKAQAYGMTNDTGKKFSISVVSEGRISVTRIK